MSDPVTNVEIEDVLSSIRRLVSEGEKLRDATTPTQSRPHHEPVEGPGPLELGDELRADVADEAPGGPVRFVLTSAFRVDAVPQEEQGPVSDEAGEDDDSGRQAEKGQSPEFAPQDEKAAPEALPPVEETPTVEEASEAHRAGEIVWTEDDPGPVGSTDQDAARNRDEVPDWVLRGQAELDALEAGETVAVADANPVLPVETDGPGEDRPEAEVRGSLESTIAELEAAIADTGDEWEPDGSEDTPVMDWDNAGDAGLFFSSRFTSGGPVEEARIATDDDIEADEVAEKFDAAEAMYSDDDIEHPDDPLQEKLTAYLEQDDVLDEETLRQMVAEIVRQELQGPLGERITRNVRKLVRREIYRALAEQGFE